VRVLNAITTSEGCPGSSRPTTEANSKVTDKLAYERGVELDFSRPGKPTDDAGVESFNGRLR
jgi:putative transposase